MMPTTKKHTPSKWRWIWILPVAVLTASAIPKILHLGVMVENLSAGGMAHMIVPLGILELSCVIVFLVPPTRKIGFLLLTAYVGGIIAAEWIGGQPPIAGIVIQSLLWTGMYFENPALFRRSADPRATP